MIIAFIISLIAAVVIHEIYAWVPKATRFLLRIAVSNLPTEIQHRYWEEWAATIEQDIPGVMSQFFYAIALQATARYTARSYDNLSYQPFGTLATGYVVGFVALVFFAPLLLVIWIVGRADGGPGLVGVSRVGRIGQRIRKMEFRTFKLEDLCQDSNFGRLLRRKELHELPTIFNIFNGTYSFVGRWSYIKELPPNECVEVLKVSPGIVSPIVLLGRSSDKLSETELAEYEISYFQRRTFWSDIQLFTKIVRTSILMIVFNK